MHCTLQIRIRQDDVRRLAAQLLVHALDRGCRRLGHFHARARRTGERHQIDARMRAHRRARARPIAIDEVEHTSRHSSLVQDLGEHDPAEGSNLGGFQHHGAAHRQRRRDLARHLIHRPVPGRDEAAHADGLFRDQRGAAQLVEYIGFEDFHRRGEMPDPDGRLRTLRQRLRCPHFLGDGVRHVIIAALIHLHDAPQQGQPLLTCGMGETRKGTLGRGHCQIHIGRRTQADHACGLLGGRVDHIQRAGSDRLHPLTVDVEISVLAHAGSPFICCDYAA